MSDCPDPQCCQDWPKGHARNCPEMERARAADPNPRLVINGPQPYTKAAAVVETLERLSATLPKINGTEGVQLILAADVVRAMGRPVLHSQLGSDWVEREAIERGFMSAPAPQPGPPEAVECLTDWLRATHDGSCRICGRGNEHVDQHAADCEAAPVIALALRTPEGGK
jgi:hypothetical protein